MDLARPRWNRLGFIIPTVFMCLLVLVLFLALFASPLSILTADDEPTGLLQVSDVYSHTIYLPFITRPLGPYVDDFDDPASGWYVGAALRWNNWVGYDGDRHEGWEEVAYMSYDQSNYHIYVPHTYHGGGDVDTWFVWPAQMSPLPDSYYPLPDDYCIEVRGIFANAKKDYSPYWAHWGIVFGATEDLSELYTFQANANHAAAALRYHNYQYPGNRQPLSGRDLNVEIPIVGWAVNSDTELVSNKYNTLRVVVQGDWVRLIANGELLAVGHVPDMPRDRIGVIGGSWEVTPVDVAIDYFKYEPNCNG